MSKNLKYKPISFGYIIASWHIVNFLSRHEKIKPDKIHSFLINSGKLGRSFPAKEGINLSIYYNFTCIDKGYLSLTQVSRESFIPLCDTDEPNINVLRAILKEIISCHNFEWLIFYDPDPEIFKEYLSNSDPEWTIMLDNAKLFNFEDDSVLAWWDDILLKYENYREEVKKAIGDIGEKLTYDHEISRVNSDGHRPAKSFVKWTARISNTFGFDILSIKGKRFSEMDNERDKIQIEVKASEISNLESFRFYVPKPEWQTALKNIDNYFFYCWPGINIQRETAIAAPFVIPAKELLTHMPKNISPIAEWSECRCVLNISNYKVV